MEYNNLKSDQRKNTKSIFSSTYKTCSKVEHLHDLALTSSPTVMESTQQLSTCSQITDDKDGDQDSFEIETLPVI